MLSSLRILFASIVVVKILTAGSIAGNTRNFDQCPASWAPYVEMIEEFRLSLPEIATHEFLFASFEANIHNCLNERFSDEYLAGLQTYLRRLRQFIDDNHDADPTDTCTVTQITSDPPSFFVVWLPYEDGVLSDIRCRSAVSKTLIALVGASQFQHFPK